MQLTNEHIDYIIKDVHYRGILVDGLKEELIDHICSAVEFEMKSGMRFIDAYHSVLTSFGHTGGLRETQKQTLTFENKNTKIMLRNYLTIAIRNLRKQSFYSVINIAGLAIGIAACIIIVLFIANELSYDHYNTKADRIYRLQEELKFGSNHIKMTYTAAPTPHSMMQDYPEIEATVRIRNWGSFLVKPVNGTENIKESGAVWTDSTFFKIFSVNVLEGNPENALKEPGSIAISRRIAEKYFPGKSALGESLILNNKYTAKVTAVYENIPKASHFHFEILVAMVGDWPVAKEAQETSYVSENFNAYILLKKGTDPKALEKKFPGFLAKYVGPQIAQAFGGDFTMEKFYASGNKYDITLMPLLDIHLHSDLMGEFEPNGNITYVYLFATIAIFILVIACINFMNLSTARSSNRAKEVGVRKVMGSLRSHLVRQFLTESTLVTLFAFVLAIGFSYLCLPVFNNLALKELSLPLRSPLFYLTLFGAALIIGMMAGLYPSFFLSSFKPINVLKGHVALGMKSGVIRSSLVVFQFVISILLIIGAITINRQLSFIQNTKLGFEKDQLLIIHDAFVLRPSSNLQAFKNEALKISGVESGTVSGYLPVDGTYRSNNSYWKEGDQPSVDNLVSMQVWDVDTDYINTLGMKIKAGRGFSAEFPADSSAIVMNEAAVALYNLGDDPIGKKISTFNGNLPDGSPDPSQIKTWTVIGVVENFHFSSMKENIKALGLFLNNSDGKISFKFNAANTQNVIQSLETIWKRLAPGQPFLYSFLDDDFGKMYASEQRLGKIFSVFASLAIVIACLGLFALTAFTAEQRTKEIGIRKVLGASVSSIVVLLSKEFGKLVFIAFVVAAPISWYAINWWLKSYTYRTEIGIFVYVVAGLFALGIAWITMSYQSIRAARNNPVDSLRSE